MLDVAEYLAAAGYQQLLEDDRAKLTQYWSMIGTLRESVDDRRLGTAEPAVSYTAWMPNHD